MKWLAPFLAPKLELNLSEKFDIHYYLAKEDAFALEQYLYNNEIPEILDNYGNTVFHVLCHKCRSLDFFKEAWTLLVKKGLNHLKYNKALELPIYKLILSNPSFYRTKELKESINFLYPEYFKLTDFPHPYDTHEYYFYKDYGFLSSQPIVKIHPVALFQYEPAWREEYIPSVHLYKSYRKYFEAPDLEALTFLITNRKCKSFKKIVNENWMNAGYKNIDLMSFICQVNLPDYLILEVLSKLVVNSSDKFGKAEATVFTHSHSPNREQLIGKYNFALTLITPLKFIKLFIETPYFNEDTIDLLRQSVELNIPLKFKNFKTTQELHDFCSIKVREEMLRKQIKDVNDLKPAFQANQNRLATMDLVLDSELEIYIPLDPEELLRWGALLNICVGSLSYMKQVANGNLNILFIYKNKEPFACCSLDAYSYRIKELKGKNNSKVQETLSGQLINKFNNI